MFLLIGKNVNPRILRSVKTLVLKKEDEIKTFKNTYVVVIQLLSRVRPFVTSWSRLGSPRQEDWSGLHLLLQGIFWTQGLSPRLPHCKQTLYC